MEKLYFDLQVLLEDLCDGAVISSIRSMRLGVVCECACDKTRHPAILHEFYNRPVSKLY